ncbi:MAG: N-acetylmuramoyl-L-alanine amidase [Bacillota bacterium]
MGDLEIRTPDGRVWAEAAPPLVVLDPGHGGSDPGAIGATGLEEKVVNLEVARYCRAILAQSGVRVVLTREEDIGVSLWRRVQQAGELGADVLVSIHSNAYRSPAAHGTETYAYYGSQAGHQLATDIQQRLCRALRRRNRGVKQAGFYVIREAPMVSALVELAFLSNLEEEALLRSDWARQRAAAGVAIGILTYLER